MSNNSSRNSVSRRDLLKLGGGLLGAAAGSSMLSKVFLQPQQVVRAGGGLQAPLFSNKAALNAQTAAPNLHMVGTDGWIYLPADAIVPPYHPDDMAPAPYNDYIFGFRDVTGLGDNTDLIYAQKMKAQLTSPLFWIDQETDFTLKLTNLGLQIRPDLIDAHTLHFHGFRNAIPIFDGEPHSSVGVPIARELTYFYRPHDPGTYMYHCHFEETEHIHMGMVGPVFVRPIQNVGEQLDASGVSIPAGKYVFNDGVQPTDPFSTRYDREFVMVLNEVWTEAHWCDSHVQLPDWSDYAPEFYLINGRVYPDTVEPNGGGTDPLTGDLISPVDENGVEIESLKRLRYQPMSSLVRANAGDRVLLRLINLGFEVHTMQLGGIKMRVVGKDATLLRGRNGSDLTYLSSAASISPGETVDAIFEAPAHSGGIGHDRYLFYNRNYNRLNNGGHAGYGGQMTEIHVYPAGTLPVQVEPNT
jgi:FtsP/CotA-like multicopper oxidase with cupredoxin domain